MGTGGRALDPVGKTHLAIALCIAATEAGYQGVHLCEVASGRLLRTLAAPSDSV